ncbi:D-Ala-D-Ala carboxypeptidase [Microbacteriaceae bacterium MWH-Ta3]|nr:D-Ala-D-Ala carboxypeptidase [Microbacteriaceae bacterium MWH-Ta3]
MRGVWVVASSAVLLLSACTPAAPEIPAPSQSAVESPSPTPSPTFDSTLWSIDEADSIWVVADKLRPLAPLDYVPDDLIALEVPHAYDARLRMSAAAMYTKMYEAAAAEGIDLVAQSTYRSYNTQVGVYNHYVATIGQTRADLQSARPGHSEHQTGLSVDIRAKDGKCTINQCFADHPAGIWLAENAWKWGFHLRYPDGKTDITGYMFEPWHYRYVGKGLAAQLHETPNITLEEYFGLPAAPDYAG